MNLFRITQRKTFNLIVAFFGLIVVFPILLITGMLIKLDSSGPVFFMQKRVGKYEKIFKIYKFRSMYVDKSSLGEVKPGMSPQKARSQYLTTIKNDPRITPVGRLVRKYYLDELPQLINVLKGEMNLVGPRPDAPSQIADYRATYWIKRHMVKPGITGFAQIYPYRRRSKTHARISLDLFYVKNRSFSLDMFILYKTLLKFIKGDSF